MKFKIINLALFSLLIMFMTVNNYAQKIEVKNVRFEVSDSDVFIYYDLMGDPKDEFEVKVYLKNGDDPKMNYEPEVLNGDYGKGKFVGRDRRIIWLMQKEFPGGIEGDKFFFVITADKIGGGIPWYVYAGTALVGGAAAVFFGLKGSPSQTPAVTAPNPPPRPGN